MDFLTIDPININTRNVYCVKSFNLRNIYPCLILNKIINPSKSECQNLSPSNISLSIDKFQFGIPLCQFYPQMSYSWFNQHASVILQHHILIRSMIVCCSTNISFLSKYFWISCCAYLYDFDRFNPRKVM